jgi:hypothetical protein
MIAAFYSRRNPHTGIRSGSEKQTARKRADLAHVNAVLRLYNPKAAAEEVRPKQLAFRQRFFGNGELTRHCLNMLREAEGLAISADDIAVAAMKAKGMPQGDDRLRQKLVSTTLAALKRLSKKGVVEKLGAGAGVGSKVAAGRRLAGLAFRAMVETGAGGSVPCPEMLKVAHP